MPCRRSTSRGGFGMDIPAAQAAPSQPSLAALASTQEKALRVNLDPTTFGTFAEIGAGQEVARWFFRAGGAKDTVAKTISAYAMDISNALYGRVQRFVSRERLQQMLEHEFNELRQELDASRGRTTRFFAFANTVAAQSYHRRKECDGWMGIRFQHAIESDPSEVMVHVRMLDPETLPQQEALGIVGVNLVEAALHWNGNTRDLLARLADNLAKGRIEVDMIRFNGPAFDGIDNRVASLWLVQLGLSDAAMFQANGDVVQASEMLYGKNVLVDRGAFRPPTRANADRLDRARSLFKQEPGVEEDKLVVLTEMTLCEVGDSGSIDYRDFLDRVDLLGALGHAVLVSNFVHYHHLADFLFRSTRLKAGIVLHLTRLRRLFEESQYQDLPGGLLESFGRLFRHDFRLFVYPEPDPDSGQPVGAHQLSLDPRLAPLLQFLLLDGRLREIREFDPAALSISGREVLARLRGEDDDWEASVPEPVAALIKERALLGYRSHARTQPG